MSSGWVFTSAPFHTRFWPFSGWESGSWEEEAKRKQPNRVQADSGGRAATARRGGRVGVVYEPEPGREARAQQHGYESRPSLDG